MLSADIVVIGGGAAGLMAAAVAARRGRRVLLLEKNRKPGAKILMSGGTRCNITQATDARGIVAAFGPGGKFLHSALASLSPEQLVALFEAEGVRTKVEPTGKIFPASNKAADVLAALLHRLTASGAEMRTELAVTSIERVIPADADNNRPGQANESNAARFLVHAQWPLGETLTLSALSVILTTGGQSYPGCGTTGDGYGWAKALGHRIAPPRPALVPLTTSAAWVPPLRGVTIPDVAISLHELDNGQPRKPLARRRGSFLFTHFGLSGPAVLDLSSDFTAQPKQDGLAVCCDFLPDEKEQLLGDRLKSAAQKHGQQPVFALLPAELPKRLLETLCQLAGMPLDRRAAEWKTSERTALVAGLKRTIVPIAGTLGFKKAEVTAGGVDLAEVDSRTMESKLCPGLYLAGEILDLAGPIGGYNFQAAFSTGHLAGEHA